MKKAVWWILIGIVLIAILVIGGTIWQLKQVKNTPIMIENTTLFTIPTGMRREALTRKLVSEGIVSSSLRLRWWLRIEQQWQHFKAGTYRLTPNMTVGQLFSQFYQGKEAQFPIRFVEGGRWQEWLALLAKAPYIKHTLSGMDNQQILARFALNDYPSAEGWFYPDTYSYTANTSDQQILQRAHDKMEQTLQRIWQQRDTGLPYQTPYQLLIMASIIEKETGVAIERGKVASVFINRLKLGMRLQTDPTVIYGMGDSYQGVITRKDLETPTAYNTYIIDGLPPTPIAMPGLASLQAAAHPEQTDYLYFVATGNGGHVFSTNLTSHNQAVELYRQVQKQRADHEQ